MKLKIELTPEEWGIVTASLRHAENIAPEPYTSVHEKIVDQLEVHFQEWEKQNKIEKL